MRRGLFVGIGCPSLHHFDVNADSRWKVDVGQSFDYFWCGIQNVYHALVDAHLELLTGVFVDEGGAIDRVFPDVDREWDGADNFGVVAGGSIAYLLDRFVEDAVLIRTHFDAKAVRWFSFFRCACRGGNGGNGRIDCRFSSNFNSPRAG